MLTWHDWIETNPSRLRHACFKKVVRGWSHEHKGSWDECLQPHGDSIWLPELWVKCVRLRPCVCVSGVTFKQAGSLVPTVWSGAEPKVVINYIVFFAGIEAAIFIKIHKVHFGYLCLISPISLYSTQDERNAVIWQRIQLRESWSWE